MSVPRISVPPAARTTLPAEGYVLEGETLRHAVRVLRLEVGAALRVVDGSGRELLCCLEIVERRRAWARVVAEAVVAPEARVAVTLCCAMLKSDKMELVLQKATELGVARIVVFSARRSVRRVLDERDLDPAGTSPLLRRWSRILEAAGAQSGRGRLPELEVCGSLEDAVARAQGCEARLVLWEGEELLRLSVALQELPTPRSIALLIGPEGGLDPLEVAAARSAGWRSVTLGKRILRAETAAVVVPALVLAAVGELG